jgi:hypothetical protein
VALHQARIDVAGVEAVLHQLPGIDREQVPLGEARDHVGAQLPLVEWRDQHQRRAGLRLDRQPLAHLEHGAAARDRQLGIGDPEHLANVDGERRADADHPGRPALLPDGPDLGADLGRRRHHCHFAPCWR